MPDSDENLPLSQNDSQSTESRMRRALGLQGPTRQAPQQRADQTRPRHRFVQDGGVPVVVLNSRSDNDPTSPFKVRVAELDAALDAERSAHNATRRTLSEALSSVQALQTRLAHAELAHKEALAVERRHRRDAEESLQAQIMMHVTQPTDLAPVTALMPAAVKTRSPAPKLPRAPRSARQTEPQPVKWWLSSFREKTR